MLHISDVQKRLSMYPEPKEVTELREKITNAFANLEFFEGPHKYILHKENGEDIQLPSVSSIVHRFEPYVDWDGIRSNKAKKLGISDAELKRQWREKNLTSTSNGSIVHLFGESCMYFSQGRQDKIEHEIAHYQLEDGFLIPYGPKEVAASKLYEDVLFNPNVYPIMAEAKVHSMLNDTLNLKSPYCGTFDILWAIREKDGSLSVNILDFKTNASLYSDFNRNKHNMMLPPFDDMVDEALSHYTIQLSAYAMTLEQLGVDVKRMILIWLKEDGTYEKIAVKDVRDRLKQVL